MRSGPTLVVLSCSTALLWCGTNRVYKDVPPPAPREFTERVAEYVTLQKKLASEAPKLTDKADPKAMSAHEDALANSIRAARARARQGDIFVTSTKPFFLKIIRSEMKGAGGKAARKTVKEGNPKLEGETKVPLAVNAKYPSQAPMSSVPVTLLQRLPRLPEELDYRFVGRTLILRDVAANIIVDYIPNAAPPELLGGTK